MADAAVNRGVSYPPLEPAQEDALRAALGPMVALANPLDYHTFIWNDVPAMSAAFGAALSGDVAMGCLVVDYPRLDRCSDAAWDCTLSAGSNAARTSGKPLAIIATLPENLSEVMAERIIEAGMIPLSGIDEAITAIEAAAALGRAKATASPILLPGPGGAADILTEAESKAALAAHGVDVPQAKRIAAPGIEEAAAQMALPAVLKGEGFAHKTEAGAVALNLGSPGAIIEAAARMNAPAYLLEEMIVGGVAELLVGVVRDPAHGFVLTLAAGGTLTEIMQDSVSLILPVRDEDIAEALGGLRIGRLLASFRGQPGADQAAILRAVRGVQDYVTENAATLEEVEINPLICTPTRAVAADALIRKGKTT